MSESCALGVLTRVEVSQVAPKVARTMVAVVPFHRSIVGKVYRDALLHVELNNDEVIHRHARRHDSPTC